MIVIWMTEVFADGVSDAATHVDANTEADAGPDALRAVLSAHSPADAVSDGDADDAPNACSYRDARANAPANGHADRRPYRPARGRAYGNHSSTVATAEQC